MKKVSVLMPAYNAEKYIYEAINSVIRQTYSNIELIIVDDGSTDKTVDIIKGFNDSRIKLYKNGENKGLPYTRNKLLSLASGEYIALMDADDICHKKRIEKQVKFLNENDNIHVVGTNFKRFNKTLNKRASVESDYRINKVRLMFINGVQNPSAMFRANFIKENNIKYRNEYIVAQDYAFWIDCLKFGNITNINEVLLYYRVGHESITKRSKDKKAALRRELLREIHKRALEQNNIKLSDNEEEILFEILDDNSRNSDKNKLLQFFKILKNIESQVHLPKKEQALQYVWQNRVVRCDLRKIYKIYLILRHRFLLCTVEDFKSVLKILMDKK